MNCCMGIPAKYAPVDTAEKSPTRAFDTGGQADMSEGFPGVTKRAQAGINNLNALFTMESH